MLFGYSTEAIYCHGGTETGDLSDAGAVSTTLFFMRLHLHAVNGKEVPLMHRAVYLYIYMIWLTPLTGICITTKQNIVSKTIAFIFL